MPNFKSRWSDWEPNNPRYGTDNADNADETDSIVSAVSPIVEHISESEDARLIAECRKIVVDLQTWLTVHCDEHMATEPLGKPEWIEALAEFVVIEGGHLRDVLGYVGCINDRGFCPTEAPVNCTACAEVSQCLRQPLQIRAHRLSGIA